MILQIRPFLILLLVLLQFAAPLIHAHTNSVAHFGASVHLPEFEQVNASPKHAPEFIASNFQNDNMVSMSSGIKNKIAQFSHTENTLFVLLLSFIFLVKVQRQPRCFSLKTEPIPPTYFFNLAAPRAPPFFTFR